MKFDTPIEVSGIQKVVINRKLVFDRRTDGWYLLTETGNSPGSVGCRTWKRSDAEMMHFVSKLLSKLKKSKKYPGCFTLTNRAWVHGDTLNIVRREP
jgi:hypothetical protein